MPPEQFRGVRGPRPGHDGRPPRSRCGVATFLLLALALALASIIVSTSSGLRRSGDVDVIDVAPPAMARRSFLVREAARPDGGVAPRAPRLLARLAESSEEVWIGLLHEGRRMMKQAGGAPLVVLEVGVHDAEQCLMAARNDFEAHCVEPSPVNFRRCQKRVRRAPPSERERVHLHNVAAGNTTGAMVDFTAKGSTGDSVGGEGRNKWTMTREAKAPNGTKGLVVQVNTSR